MKRCLITLCVFLILLSVINIREAASQQQVDRSGNDILCNRLGDQYTPCNKGISVCRERDGDLTICDCKTGECTFVKDEEIDLRPGQVNANRIKDLLTLKFLSSISTQLNNVTSQLGNVEALCSLSDLVPLARPLITEAQNIVREPGDVCQRDSQGRLVFRVHNQGNVEAPASITRVFFGCPNASCAGPTQVDLDTPALAGFSGTELAVTIPDNCFSTTTLKCDFKIGVDAGEAVTEANEANNTTAGVCGPSIL